MMRSHHNNEMVDHQFPSSSGKRRVRSSPQAATAFHEAGHAVVATLKAVRFRHVTIEETDDAAGHIQYLRPAKSLGQTHARGIVALAGEAAQRRFNPLSVRRHHGDGDREVVALYACEVTGSSEQASLLVKLWEVQARDLVAMRWTVIERVAAALLERQRLTMAECQALMIPGAAVPLPSRPTGAST